MTVDAIVLAGGAARRLDGADKPALDVGGATMLDHVLAAVAQASRIVVVGPPRALPRGVTGCREDPPGGGPVAALAAGVRHVGAPVVLVLGADLPWIAPAVPMLLTAAPADGLAALVDAGGRTNHLAAAWRLATLQRRLATAPAAGGAMRALAEDVDLVAVPDTGGWGADCDTWDDLAAARARAQTVRSSPA